MPKKPRTFKHFPKSVVCPVCKTSDDGECVLLTIVGTSDGHVSEAKPVHLWCAVATHLNSTGTLVLRTTKGVYVV